MRTALGPLKALAAVVALAGCSVPLPEPSGFAEANHAPCVRSCEKSYSSCAVLARYAGPNAPRNREACRHDLATCYTTCEP